MKPESTNRPCPWNGAVANEEYTLTGLLSPGILLPVVEVDREFLGVSLSP